MTSARKVKEKGHNLNVKWSLQDEQSLAKLWPSGACDQTFGIIKLIYLHTCMNVSDFYTEVPTTYSCWVCCDLIFECLYRAAKMWGNVMYTYISLITAAWYIKHNMCMPSPLLSGTISVDMVRYTKHRKWRWSIMASLLYLQIAKIWDSKLFNENCWAYRLNW